jgi:thioredoxin 1
MAEVLDVTDQTFEAEVLQAGKPAIVDFWAEWCAPCRQIAPIIKELAAQYGDQVTVVKVDVDSNPGIAGRYGVRSIPTVLAISGGQVVEQLVGARPKADFEAMVKKVVA